MKELVSKDFGIQQLILFFIFVLISPKFYLNSSYSFDQYIFFHRTHLVLYTRRDVSYFRFCSFDQKVLRFFYIVLLLYFRSLIQSAIPFYCSIITIVCKGETCNSTVTLPYIKRTTDTIGRLLRKHNKISTAYNPLKKMSNQIRRTQKIKLSRIITKCALNRVGLVKKLCWSKE